MSFVPSQEEIGLAGKVVELTIAALVVVSMLFVVIVFLTADPQLTQYAEVIAHFTWAVVTVVILLVLIRQPQR